MSSPEIVRDALLDELQWQGRLLAVCVARLGGRVHITAEEFEEHRAGVSVLKDNTETILTTDPARSK